MFSKKPFIIHPPSKSNLTFATIVGLVVFFAQKNNREMVIDMFKHFIKSVDEKMNTTETK